MRGARSAAPGSAGSVLTAPPVVHRALALLLEPRVLIFLVALPFILHPAGVMWASLSFLSHLSSTLVVSTDVLLEGTVASYLAFAWCLLLIVGLVAIKCYLRDDSGAARWIVGERRKDDGALLGGDVADSHPRTSGKGRRGNRTPESTAVSGRGSSIATSVLPNRAPASSAGGSASPEASAVSSGKKSRKHRRRGNRSGSSGSAGRLELDAMEGGGIGSSNVADASPDLESRSGRRKRGDSAGRGGGHIGSLIPLLASDSSDDESRDARVAAEDAERRRQAQREAVEAALADVARRQREQKAAERRQRRELQQAAAERAEREREERERADAEQRRAAAAAAVAASAASSLRPIRPSSLSAPVRPAASTAADSSDARSTSSSSTGSRKAPRLRSNTEPAGIAGGKGASAQQAKPKRNRGGRRHRRKAAAEPASTKPDQRTTSTRNPPSRAKPGQGLQASAPVPHSEPQRVPRAAAEEREAAAPTTTAPISPPLRPADAAESNVGMRLSPSLTGLPPSSVDMLGMPPLAATLVPCYQPPRESFVYPPPPAANYGGPGLAGVPLQPAPRRFPDSYGSPADVPSGTPLVLHGASHPPPRTVDEARLDDTFAMAYRMSSSLLDD